jgi:hypothetical protein
MKTPYKISLILASIVALCILAFNLGHDVLPGAYYVGGPGLTSHTFTTSEYASINAFETGLIVICHLLTYLVVAIAEGLVAWLILYLLCRLLTRPASPGAVRNVLRPPLGT